MSYPETIILSVATHGTIPTFIDGSLEKKALTFELPQGMTFKKISAVSPGVCNIMDTGNADEYIQNIINWVKTLKPMEIMKDDTASEVASYLRKEDYENEYLPISREVHRFKRKQNRNFSQQEDEEPDKEEVRYLDNWDKNYKLGTYYNPAKYLRSATKIPSRSEVLNKIYSRSNETEQFKGVWDYQIIALNVVGFPDIMREIEGRSHKGNSIVYSHEIFDFLHSKGVKNVILIDLSCSSFDDDNIDNRTLRLLQRELLSEGLHGGKKKNTRKRSRKPTKKNKPKYKRKKTRRYKKY